MRVLLLAILASCVPSQITETAAERLGASGRHLHLVDQDGQTYTFCRDERRSLLGGRAYDGACVILICNANGSDCR